MAGPVQRRLRRVRRAGVVIRGPWTPVLAPEAGETAEVVGVVHRLAARAIAAAGRRGLTVERRRQPANVLSGGDVVVVVQIGLPRGHAGPWPAVTRAPVQTMVPERRISPVAGSKRVRRLLVGLRPKRTSS